MKKCLRCGHAILGEDDNAYRSRKRHPFCAELEKREQIRRFGREKTERERRRRAALPPKPPPPPKAEPARNPRGTPEVDEIMRRVDEGRVRDDDEKARRAFDRLAREAAARFGRAS